MVKLAPDYIIFFDGLTGEFKSDANISEFIPRGDITQPVTSDVKISQKTKVKQGDIWYIPDTYPLSGTVAEIDTNIYTNDQIVSLYVGSDVYTNDVLMPTNSIVPNLSDNNSQAYTVNVQGNSSVTGVDYLMGIDTITRQLMRLEPCLRIMDKDSCTVQTDPEPENVKFRLDDPIISVENIYFAEDRFNVLTLYNRENLSQSTTYYMSVDGTISTTLDTSFLHRKMSMIVEPNEYNLAYASSTLKSQGYNNEIEFTIPSDNDIGLLHDETLLGKKVTIYIEGYPPLESIISAYSMPSYNKIRIVVGLSRSRMTDYLNTEV